LRYIDDFLFISDDLFTARRFVDVMSKGFPAYGAHISPGKTLLSFRDPLTTNGAQVLSSLGGGGSEFNLHHHGLNGADSRLPILRVLD
jgi:hypothetical protein